MTGGPGSDQQAAARGRLTFRPGPARPGPAERTGQFELAASSGGARALVYVPADVGPDPMRLVVLLHGAGGNAERGLTLLRAQADEERLILVAPKSRASTWDVIAGGFGPDVSAVDRLLTQVSALAPVSGFTVGGFSDGASYALTLGMSNGDVFDTVIAFSPGFTAAEETHGRPRLFFAHGTQDRVLPIEACSRRLVPELEDRGYDVTYREFEGGHEVPVAIRQQAMRWLSS